MEEVIQEYSEYIKGETLTSDLSLRRQGVSAIIGQQHFEPILKIDIIEGVELAINISKV